MRLFTICSGSVYEYVKVITYRIGEQKFPVITVGEEGRGRKLGILPVTLTPASREVWEEKGEVKINQGQVEHSEKTKRPYLIETTYPLSEIDTEKVLCVFRTKIGFRGGNKHDLPNCEIIVTGEIAQGDAGRAGWGCQYIAIVPKNTVIKTSYSGRLYGGPRAHLYVWNGEKFLAATEEEREIFDLF